MKAANVIDPAQQPDRHRIWFGATVTLCDDEGRKRVLVLTGDDETDASAGRISWNSPFGRAVLGASVGDIRRVRLPVGERDYEILAIAYPTAAER